MTGWNSWQSGLLLSFSGSARLALGDNLGLFRQKEEPAAIAANLNLFAKCKIKEGSARNLQMAFAADAVSNYGNRLLAAFSQTIEPLQGPFRDPAPQLVNLGLGMLGPPAGFEFNRLQFQQLHDHVFHWLFRMAGGVPIRKSYSSLLDGEVIMQEDAWK
jgi:hypothetical protein